MNDLAVRFDHVTKRFRRGEMFDSLRDLVPNIIRTVTTPRSKRVVKNEFCALRGVTFSVKKGEAVGIIGHNGAGKSTMLKHLAGIMTPTEGVINVNGRISALIEVGAGFHPDLTGRENVYLNGVILGMSRREVASKFDDIVAFAGLQDAIDTPVKRYSSGMYARLGFSVAVHLDPEILIIDEVLSVGDFVFQAKSLEKIKSIARSGATVLFVSHNLKAVADVCERALLMENGQIVLDASTSEVIKTYVEREQADVAKQRGGEIVINSVKAIGASGPSTRFQPGDTMRVKVEFEARQHCSKVAVVVAILDEKLGELFHTSTEQLGHPPADLQAGHVGTATFEMTLHLANGTFYLAAYLYRYDIQRVFDRMVPASTFYVSSNFDLVGPLHAYPKLVEFDILTSPRKTWTAQN